MLDGVPVTIYPKHMYFPSYWLIEQTDSEYHKKLIKKLEKVVGWAYQRKEITGLELDLKI